MSVQARARVRVMLLASVIGIVVAYFALGPSPAAASQLVAVDTSNQKISVNANNTALIQYTKGGVRKRELYWGARNGTLRFRYDRSGGWRSKRASWQSFSNSCGSYTGPQLYHVVASCTAPDGTHWVLQEWVRTLHSRLAMTGPRELRLSHFTGEPAELRIWTDWYHSGRYRHMWGQYLYKDQPVFSNSWRSDGYVLDRRGRNIYVDSYNSDIGTGWRRVNAFLSHAPSGQFCFGFGPKPGFAFTGRSYEEWYRASVAGPGVSPDVFVMFRGQLGAYDAQLDAQHNWWQGHLSNWATTGSCSLRN